MGSTLVSGVADLTVRGVIAPYRLAHGWPAYYTRTPGLKNVSASCV